MVVQIHNIIRYLIIFILNLFVMIVFQSYLNFVFLIMLLILPIYSVVGFKQVEQKVSLQLFVPEDAMKKGEEFLVRFQISNPTVFPLMNGTIFFTVENPFYDFKGEHTLNLPVWACLLYTSPSPRD